MKEASLSCVLSEAVMPSRSLLPPLQGKRVEKNPPCWWGGDDDRWNDDKAMRERVRIVLGLFFFWLKEQKAAQAFNPPYVLADNSS